MFRRLLKKTSYYLQYFPFTINTVLMVLIAWGCYYILKGNPLQKGEMQTDALHGLIVIMAKVILVFAGLIAGLSILSTILSWSIFMIGKDEQSFKTTFEVTENNKKKRTLYIHTLIQSVYRPVLGFVKGRIIYDQQDLTDKFSLLSGRLRKGGFLAMDISGKSELQLPDIKEYHLREGFIFFEDMLRLISLPVRQKLKGQFYQPPVANVLDERELAPRNTESLDIRIEQMRRVEGDPLHYKDFESGDDVRRIVWKVYAKNKELVVRVPERFEPYASHLLYYASFYSVFPKWNDNIFVKEMLNYYKNAVWSVYEELKKKEFVLKFVGEEKTIKGNEANSDQETLKMISASGFHQSVALDHYFNPHKGTVLCISSLSDKESVAALLEQTGTGTLIYFVKLSRQLKKFYPLAWLHRLLFLPPKDRRSRIKARWPFSPVRFGVLKNEKSIEQLLSASSTSYVII